MQSLLKYQPPSSPYPIFVAVKDNSYCVIRARQNISSLHIGSSSNLTTPLRNGHDYVHLTNEQQSLRNGFRHMPKVTELVSGRTGIQTQGPLDTQ